MTIITEEKEIVGTILVQGWAFELLELYPQRRTSIPSWFREHVFEFIVVNSDGFAQPLIVSRTGFHILPALDVTKKNVKFVLEENNKEELTLQDINDSLASVFPDRFQS